MESKLSQYALYEYLAGRATPLEKKQTEEWLRDARNHETFYAWLLEWEARSPQYVPNHEQAVQNLLLRIENNVPDETTILEWNHGSDHSESFNFRKFWIIAASILFVASSGWWFRDTIMYKTYETGYGETSEVKLGDGSQVSLNSNSSLRVPRFGFGSGGREVLFKGEAEFSVKHTPDDQRFVVRTSDTFQVEVLGTEFSVFSRARGNKVALKSGSVRIDYGKEGASREMVMEPGDLATVDTLGVMLLEKKQNTENITAWKEQRYVFNGTSLREISAMIEENFGQKVILASEAIAERTITGNFKTKNADDLLKTISEVLDLRIRTSGDSTLISAN